MANLIDELTPQEVEDLLKIDEKYSPRIDEAKALSLLTIKLHAKAREIAEQENRPFTETEEELSERMIKAADDYNAIISEWQKERDKITQKAKARAFKAYNGNIADILAFIKENVPAHIAGFALFAGKEPTEKEREEESRRAIEARKEIEDGIKENKELLKQTPDDKMLQEATKGLEDLLNSGAYIIKNTYDLTFSDETLRSAIYESFANYLDFLEKAAPDAYKEACDYIESCIENKKEIRNAAAHGVKQKPDPGRLVKTVAPKEHITTTDKLSGKAFDLENDIFYTKNLVRVGVEKKGSKKEINTLLRVSFDELEDHGVIIDTKKLTPFDREVHDAIITLFAEGGNDTMSVEMIYRAMIGKPRARVMPKQAEAISQSISKMMRTLIEIDATEEAAAYGFEKLKYKGNLLYAEMAIATINNNVVDALHVIKEPILYTYASKTNKIGRVNMKLLDTPINKNEETIILQGYLYRRILAMQHGQNKSIVYDTVYKQLEIKAPNGNALRKKKNDVRSKIKALLDYWKKEKFISGYVENKRGQEIYSVTIRLVNEK